MSTKQSFSIDLFLCPCLAKTETLKEPISVFVLCFPYSFLDQGNPPPPTPPFFFFSTIIIITININILLLLLLINSFWDRVSRWAWSSSIRLNWLLNKPLGSVCRSSRSCWPGFKMWMLGWNEEVTAGVFSPVSILFYRIGCCLGLDSQRKPVKMFKLHLSWFCLLTTLSAFPNVNGGVSVTMVLV